MKTNEVFGISTQIRQYSYVDRGYLDEKIGKYLQQDKHIALQGSSKCGKSWLRQRCIPDANTVQCRIGKKVSELFVEALGNLGIRLELENEEQTTIKGTVEGTGQAGVALLAKAALKLGLDYSH